MLKKECGKLLQFLNCLLIPSTCRLYNRRASCGNMRVSRNRKHILSLVLKLLTKSTKEAQWCYLELRVEKEAKENKWNRTYSIFNYLRLQKKTTSNISLSISMFLEFSFFPKTCCFIWTCPILSCFLPSLHFKHQKYLL